MKRAIVEGTHRTFSHVNHQDREVLWWMYEEEAGKMVGEYKRITSASRIADSAGVCVDNGHRVFLVEGTNGKTYKVYPDYSAKEIKS